MGSAQYCGTFALALHRVLERAGIRSQLVLVCAGENGEPRRDEDGGPYWRHAAVKIGDAYYDVHGKNAASDLYDNYLWGMTVGEPLMYVVTAEELKAVLLMTDGSYSERRFGDWGNRLGDVS